jgi:hypothetical protein
MIELFNFMATKILDETSNAAIVQLPGRKFPGIVVQGDSLQILLSQVTNIKEHLISEASDDLRNEIEDLYNTVRGSAHYEKVLTKNAIELPYAKK